MSTRIFEARVERTKTVRVLLRKQEPRASGSTLATLGSCFRRSTVAAFLLLAACNSSNDVPETTADVDGKLFCATGGASEMTQSCVLERVDGPDGHILVVHHPGGGFRRFRIVRDGRGVIPADGAEQAKLFIVAENMIDVAIGEDRYRFPAIVAPVAD